MRIKKTVYTKPFETAYENGEVARYHESNKLNADCAAAIDKCINESNYSPNHYNLKSAAQNVIEQYGEKRVAWVIAGTIQRHNWDGRLSESNKEWAKGFSIPLESNKYYAVRSHLCLVEGFTGEMRKLCAERKKIAATDRALKREKNLSDSGQSPEMSPAKKTLAEHIENGKRKMAQQNKSTPQKTKKREEELA